MQLVKIYPDRVQIRSDGAELGDLSIYDALLLSDERQDNALVCVVSSITRNEAEEQFDFDGNLLDTESTSSLECSVIGSLRGGVFQKSVDHYPTTHVKIRPIEGALFASMLDQGGDAAFRLGRYANYDCAAMLDGNKFFSRHAAILGNTGSGKSFAVASILEKLNALKSANVVLFDLHGEYSGLDYVKSIKIGQDGLSFPLWFLSLRDIAGNLLKIKEESAQLQIAALRKAFYAARCSDKSEDLPLFFSMEDVIAQLEDENSKEINTGEVYKTGEKAGMAKTVKAESNGKLTGLIGLLQDKLLDARYAFMTRKEAQSYLFYFIQELFGMGEKRIKVLDLSAVPSDMIPTVIAVTTKLLYRVQLQQERRTLRPLSILCDEAHVYIPSSEFGLGASQRRLLEVFETIAKEGRKFGVSLLAVSQRPSELNRTILAQCANFIVLKLSNETDKQLIKGILPGGSRSLVDSVNLFRPGDCLVVGDSAPISFKVTIDLPQQAPDSDTIPTWDLWAREANLDTDALTQALLKQ